WMYLTAVVPTLLVTVVLVIAYDQRFALAMGVLHALLVNISLELPMAVTVTTLVGVGVSVAPLREVRSRSKIVLVGIFAGLAMAATWRLVGMGTREREFGGELMFRRIIQDALIALTAGVATGLFVQGVLPGIEKLF